ncbi:MAG: 2-hydroxychromene-2-carboxylate isomerase [Phenylobacterium sp.]|uniref:2-hydroxychromene-2-carboxylate isomerase n=1 Tax=Phenylobacterium sp. TaxID=1871053 RepID=UPI0027350770|nr:2-hydroxychromene-2-carboxylate isomerase [Phenylobacterium sp.]MDP3747388.1 2-hydroxychromene-2-carboxylate isomerase [Phenylobacterium sp.]
MPARSPDPTAGQRPAPPPAALGIDFYFDFASPYGWIAAERIGAIAHRFGRRVNWRPFLLRVTVLEAMGLPPPIKTPLKGDYLLHDIGRSLRHHGLTLAPDPRLDISSLNAARAVLWALATSPESVEALVLALYRAQWSEGRDISTPATVLDVVTGLGLSRRDAADALRDEAVKAALREATSSAIGAGVFGSPTTVIDGEMFWGADRLPMVERWLESGGW